MLSNYKFYFLGNNKQQLYEERFSPITLSEVQFSLTVEEDIDARPVQGSYP